MSHDNEKAIRILLLLFVFSLVTYGIKLGFNTFLSHKLTASQYGDFNLAFNIVTIISTIGLFGTKASSFKYLSVYFTYNNKHIISRYIKWNIRLLSIISIIILAVAGIGFVIMRLGEPSLVKSLDSHIIVYFLWLTPLFIFNLILSKYILSNKNYITLSILELIGKNSLLLLLFVVIIYIFKQKLDNTSMSIALGLSLIISTLIVLLTLVLVLKNKKSSNGGKDKIDSSEDNEKKWFSFSSKAILNDVIVNIFSVVDLIVIEIVHPSEDALGHYSAILVLTGFIWVLLAGMYQYTHPNISQKAREKKYHELQVLLNKSNYIVCSIVFVIAALIIIFADKLLGFFGPGYQDVSVVLTIVCFTSALGSLYATPQLILLLAGREKTLLKIKLAALVILIVGCVPLTIYFGLIGTGIATLIGTLSLFIPVYFATKKYYPIKPLIFF